MSFFIIILSLLIIIFVSTISMHLPQHIQTSAVFHHSQYHSDNILQIVHNSPKYRMPVMNSDDILQFAKSIENLSFLVNSASCKIMVESYILIRF